MYKGKQFFLIFLKVKFQVFLDLGRAMTFVDDE